MGRLIIYFAICLILVPYPVSATKLFHQYVQNRWSIEEGLLQVVGSTMAQDANGYIWIGSQVGLTRFDGVKFDTYPTADIPELSGSITQLKVDSQHRLWVGSTQSLVLYQNHAFHAIPFAKTLERGGRSTLSIRDITEIPQGRILVSSNLGLFEVIDNQLHRFRELELGDPHALFADESGLWVGGIGQVTYSGKDFKKTYSFSDSPKTIKVTNLVTYQSKIWVGTTKGLYFINNDRLEKFEGHPLLTSLAIDAMMPDSNNELWVATTQGLFRILHDSVFEFIDNQDQNAFKVILSMLEDYEGNIWFGSYIHGIARLYRGSTFNFGVESGLSDPFVWSVQADSSDPEITWVGTNSGLDKLYRGKFTSEIKGHQLPNPVVYTMLVEDDKIWLGTRGGVALYKDKKVITPALLSQLNKHHVRSIINNNGDGYFFGTDAGLYWYQNGTLEHFPVDATGQTLAIRYLLLTKDGRLLLGCEDGVYERRDSKIHKIYPDVSSSEKIDTPIIYENHDGSIIIGTMSSGLVFLADGKSHRFNKNNSGIPTPGAFFIANDSKGTMWISSFNGLYRFPYKNIENQLIGIKNSLDTEMLLDDTGRVFGAQKSNCCTGGGTAKGIFVDDWLTLPSRTGVIRINTDKVHDNLVTPKVKVERFYYDNNSHDVNNGQTFILDKTNRDVAFEFTLLSYQAPRNLIIEYQLVGYDKEWKRLSDNAKRNASYTNLPSGNYSFRVRGANNSGVWNREDATITFEIRPYFYETFWFYFAVVLTLVSLFYYWHHRRLKTLKEQQKLLEKTVQLRTRELSIANQKLLDISLTDPLTGLKNRRYLEMQLPKDINYLERQLQKNTKNEDSMVFMMVDIDKFKRINDDYGHACGDQIITRIAELFTQVLREYDYVVRWGGEEFLLIMRTKARDEAELIAQRLSRLSSEVNYSDILKNQKSVTCSIGYCCFPLLPDKEIIYRFQWLEYVDLADKALYQVKAHGRNGWAAYYPHSVTMSDCMEDASSFDTLIKQGKLGLRSSW